MSGLILKLSPGERILINGAVIENGDRRTRLSIKTPDAKILRLRDAIHPTQATTPVKRLCYAVQLVLSGDRDPKTAKPDTLRAVCELSNVFVDAESQKQLDAAKASVEKEDFYRCLKAIRGLIATEEKLLAMAQ